mgnify:CR=1 FL=1
MVTQKTVSSEIGYSISLRHLLHRKFEIMFKHSCFLSHELSSNIMNGIKTNLIFAFYWLFISKFVFRCSFHVNNQWLREAAKKSHTTGHTTKAFELSGHRNFFSLVFRALKKKFFSLSGSAFTPPPPLSDRTTSRGTFFAASQRRKTDKLEC